MSSTEEVPFTKQMRNVTREIHNVSDALINAKLGIAMSEDRVWAEGLLIFYEIFKYLEEALDRLSHTLISDLDIPGMRRKEAFEKVSALERSIRCDSKVYEIDITIFSFLPFVFHEKSSGKPFQRFKSNPIFQDLAFYLGSNWKDGYKPRESVCQYLKHLEKIEQENPYYLMSYIYHLYMGLLSGGQILRRKKVLLQKFSFSRKDSVEGMAVTEIDTSVSRLKREMTEAMNRIAEELDEETKQRLLDESKMVFILNNSIVHSVEGAGSVVAMKILKFASYGVLSALLFVYIKRMLVG